MNLHAGRMARAARGLLQRQPGMRITGRTGALIAWGLAAFGAAAAAEKAPDSSAHYVRMKHVQIVDGDLHMPAINAMIPTDWQFQGLLRNLGGMGGCFADLKSMYIHAQSADGSTES